MSFLDKAKSKATQISQQAKEKFDDYKETKKVDELLDDLGRITYRQHTGRSLDGDQAEVAVLVRKLQDLEAEGIEVLPVAKPDGAAEAESGSPTTRATDAPPPPFAPPSI